MNASRRSQLLRHVQRLGKHVQCIRRQETMARHAVYRRKCATSREGAPVKVEVYRQAMALGCSDEESVLLRAALRIRGEATMPLAGAMGQRGEASDGQDHVGAHGSMASIGIRRARGAAVSFLGAQYLCETRVVIWMATCNVRGVAPSTIDIIGELVRQWPSNAVSAQSIEWLRRVRFVRSARRRWAQHFRLRWRVRWRRLSARSELSAVPEAQKAFFF
jgi:hypothetical protein